VAENDLLKSPRVPLATHVVPKTTKEMNAKTLLREQIAQFLYVFYSAGDALRFAHKNRIWEGFMAYGWASRLFALVGTVAGLKFLHILWQYLMKVDESHPFAAAGMLGGFFQELLVAEYELLFMGGMKYGTMVLLEILIFHITFRTLCILLVKSGQPTLKDFIRAQVRMFKVSLACLVLESLGSMVARGLPFASVSVFLIQCAFMGIPILDNFLEQFDFGIRQSIRYTMQFAGVALGLGLMLQVCFLVPVLGNVVGPVVASITSVLVLYELSDLTRSKEASLTLEEELV
jgi:hypothetical protein